MFIEYPVHTRCVREYRRRTTDDGRRGVKAQLRLSCGWPECVPDLEACGRMEMVKGSWLKPGCAVIDVGINAKDDDTKKRRGPDSPSTDSPTVMVI